MKEKKKKIDIRLGIVAALVIGIMFSYVVLPRPVFEQDDQGWHILWEGNLAEAAEGDPGGGYGGFLAIYFHPHNADPGATYDDNDSSTMEANCTAAYGFSNAEGFNLEIDRTVTFDIVIRCRFNETQAKEGTYWNYNDTQIAINSTGGGIDLSGVYGKEQLQIVTMNPGGDTGQTSIFINFVWNNNNTGYTISDGGTCTFTNIKIEARY